MFPELKFERRAQGSARVDWWLRIDYICDQARQIQFLRASQIEFARNVFVGFL